jgi:hypothetical protein
MAALIAVVAPRSAAAWYFPEHAELTRLALRDFAAAEVTLRIGRVTALAAQEKMSLCPEAVTALHAAPTSGPHACVPYGALAALAADHSNDARDLRAILTNLLSRPTPMPNKPLGILLTEAAQQTWVDFQESAPPEAIRIWTEQVSRMKAAAGGAASGHSVLQPRDFVRKLDADLFVIDPGYISRAKDAKTHFHDPTSAMEIVLLQTALGSADNALAQAIAHHARSLQLAVRSRARGDRSVDVSGRVEALLEHAFALHFIEDGFAAGHIATDPAIASPERRAQRHDYFNRQGLAVTRALAKRRCDDFQDPNRARTLGLGACWLARGDGFASAEDRWYVGEAVARIQTAFAVALEGANPEWQSAQEKSPGCEAWMDADGTTGDRPGETCDMAWMAMLLDPHPEWLEGMSSARQKSAASAAKNRDWASAILNDFEKALQLLAAEPSLSMANAGMPSAQPGIMPVRVLGTPLEPADDPCSTTAWQARLWCPLLAGWPEAQADVASLEGTDSFGRGLQFQLLASAMMSDANPFRDRGLLGVSGGIGAGIAFMTRGVFADRGARSLFEINAGLGQGIALVNGTHQFPAMVVVEARAPLTTLLLYGAGKLWKSRVPLSILGEGFSAGFFGLRAYWSTNSGSPLINAWDVEVVNMLLKRSPVTSTGALGFLDTEGRLRVGARSPQLNTAMSGLFRGELLISFEVNGGYFF